VFVSGGVMSSDSLELIRLRNNFYRDNYRRVMGLLVVLSVALLILVATLIYIVLHRPEPKYYATTQAGRVLQLVPLNQPILNSAAIIDWASQVAASSYTYSFINYRQKIQKLEPYFTKNGWQSFLKGLQDSSTLTAMEANKLIVSAVVSGTPVVVNQAVLSGRYAWKVQVPVLVTFQSASEKYQNKYMITIVIVRDSTLQNARGIAIEQFYAQ
jgi:intracellular multiplication protein IcmL